MAAAVNRRKWPKIIKSDIEFPLCCGLDYTFVPHRFRPPDLDEGAHGVPGELDDQRRHQDEKDPTHETAAVAQRQPGAGLRAGDIGGRHHHRQ